MKEKCLFRSVYQLLGDLNSILRFMILQIIYDPMTITMDRERLVSIGENLF
jgi:hypothetical protein